MRSRPKVIRPIRGDHEQERDEELVTEGERRERGPGRQEPHDHEPQVGADRHGVAVREVRHLEDAVHEGDADGAQGERAAQQDPADPEREELVGGHAPDLAHYHEGEEDGYEQRQHGAATGGQAPEALARPQAYDFGSAFCNVIHAQPPR